MLTFGPVPGETRFEEMQRYVRFGEADARLLAAFRDHASPSLPRVAEEFYDRIREHEQAHEVLQSEEQAERLKTSLVRWMERILTGPYDERYFERTSMIGRAHVRIGLPQRYMFTGMALIRVALNDIADATMGEDAPAVRRSLASLLDVELAIILDAYREDYVERVQRLERLERAELDRTLARTQHRYVSAVELAKVLIVGIDANGVVRMFNREAERVTGFGREEAVGASFAETFVPEGTRDGLGAVVADAIAGRGLHREVLESVVLTKSGKLRDVRWQLAYSPSPEEDEVVLFAIGQDITDQNVLAARVRQAEKLAAVGTLAAGLAHEIRNPLNGAQLHVTFLARGLRRAGIDDEETLDAVRVVGEEIKRLSTLVSEFLDFARPRPLEKRTVSIPHLCERAAQLVAPVALSSHVVVKSDMPKADIVLSGDAAKLEQVLLNLLHNAVEAMSATGGGLTVIRARRHPRHAVIEVEDEGPGLSNADAPIFDPFYSTKPHGTGLGLAIVHRIVTDHGGTVDVQSRPGHTVFRVTLPIGVAERSELEVE